MADKKDTDKIPQKREEWMEAGLEHILNADQAPRRKRKELEREEQERKRMDIRQQRELNPAIKSANQGPETTSESLPKRRYEFGDRGSSWRMMKLKRVLETAEKEKRPVDQVALERYGSIEDFNEAMEEKAFLESKGTRSREGSSNSLSRSSSFSQPLLSKERSQFLKPKEEKISASSPQAITRESQASLEPSATPVSVSHGVPTLQELNKMKSQALKAKLMKKKDAAELERKYQESLELYQKHEASLKSLASTRQVKQEEKQPQDKSMQDEIQALVKEEKLRGKDTNMDQAFANRIARSGNYQNTLDFMDDNAEMLSSTAPKKGSKSTDTIPRVPLPSRKNQSCTLCLNANEKFRNRIVASGSYIHLVVSDVVGMTEGQCQIVPHDHVISTLELDDNAWVEIRNFQKTLIQMFASQNQSVLFMEQLVNPKWANHIVIECIPVPNDVFEDAPAYFKEALLESEEEWSQHKKIIDTSRGFRRSMVKDLPYFHVWFDPNGGMGHVIEDPESWPQWFGREVIAGPLDLPPDVWRKPKRLSDHEVRQSRISVHEMYKPFDWTAALQD